MENASEPTQLQREELIHDRNGKRTQAVVKQFALAAQPEIMRAAEKDDQYASYVYEACHESVRHLFGTRYAVAFQNETKLAGQMLYYLMTTGAGQQTLGEEYCDLMQIAGTSGLSPTPARRLSLILLQAALPYIAERLSARIATRGMLLAFQNHEDTYGPLHVRGNHNVTAVTSEESPQRHLGSTGAKAKRLSIFIEKLKKIFLAAVQKWPLILPSVQEATQLVVRTNLMLFYFEGLYYHIAKRTAGIRYAFIGKHLQQRPRYHILGIFLLIQLLIIGADRIRHHNFSVVANAIRPHTVSNDFRTAGGGTPVLNEDGNLVTHPNTGKEEWMPITNTAETVSSSKCSLCLSPREFPTATPCGHVFCWKCVAEWCNEKAECPLCRSPMSHSSLVCLYHSDF